MPTLQNVNADQDPSSWSERHPLSTFLLVLGGIALIVWLIARKRGELPALPDLVPQLAPPPLVSVWSPLQ